MLTHLDLFTGIGGFHLAAEWAGFQTIGFSEIEPYCCKLLAQKWPEIKNYGSVDNTESFRELRGRITVLSAGVPCQPASLAGKRKGKDDARWKWPATLAIVELVRPAYALFENPPGILSLREFETVLLRLDSLGYQVRLFSVPANAVGADHLRYRVFIVANADDNGQSSAQEPGILGSRAASQSQGQASRQTGTGEPEGSNGSQGRDKILADTNGPREPQPRGFIGEVREWPEHSSETLADADSAERRPTQSARDEHHGPETGRRESADRYQGVCDPDAADAESERLQGIRTGGHQEPYAHAGETISVCSSGRSDFRQLESGVRRVAHDVPSWPYEPMPRPLCTKEDKIKDRSARLKALGNSCVPAQCYPFFKAIYEVETCQGKG